MKVFWGLIFIIVLSGTVLAVPPILQQTSFTSGYNIKVPVKEVFKLNQPYNFEFHVYNITDGRPISSGIGCYMHLYNRNGSHVYEGYSNTSDHNFDYGFDLVGSNFSVIGQYYYNIQCNNSILGGYAGEYIYVTAQGVPYSTIHGLIYVCVFALLIGLFWFLIFYSFNMEVDNIRNGEGKVIAINYKRHLRTFIFTMAYVCFIAIAYFAWNISYGILEFTEMESFFKMIFRTAYVLMYPLFVIILIWSIAQFIKDRKAEEWITRNLSFK